MQVTLSDLSFFRMCQLKDRVDWWATFSVEPNGSIYPFVTWGYTRHKDRIPVRDLSPKLAEIADLYISLRPSGGRFFLNRAGVYFHESENGPYDQFIQFEIIGHVVFVPKNKNI